MELSLIRGNGKDDQREKPRRSAIYLIGHGPYREPRLVELQYLRIGRYLDALFDQPVPLVERPTLKHVYIDLNFPRRIDRDYLPNLRKLLDEVAEGSIGTVFVDIRHGAAIEPHHPEHAIYWLEQAGAKVYNTYYDDEEVIANLLAEHYGEDGRHAVPQGDADDVVALFPALAASVVREALRHELRSERYDVSVPMERIWREISSLASENPYTSSEIPLLSSQRSSELWDKHHAALEEERKRRKEIELLYRLGPDAAGKLIDEGHWDRPVRTPDGIAWAEDRLGRELGFEKELSDRLVTYRRSVDGHDVYADLRSVGRITFIVYAPPAAAPPVRRRRGATESGPRHLGSFYLLDSWKHGLSQKFTARFEEVMERTARHSHRR